MKRWAFLVAAVVVAALVTGVILLNRPDRVATLNGHPITQDELVFHMDRLERTTSGDSPLSDRVLDEIKHDKTLWLLAQEQGLVDSVDHADLLASLDEENKRRARTAAEGGVVHGLVEFGAEEYYAHRLAELTTALRQALSDQLPVTDAEVRAAFDADKAQWSANATVYTYRELVVPEALDLEVVASRLATLATVTVRGESRHDQDLLAVLSALGPGQISAPVIGAGQVTYYELTGRTVDERAAFATYASRIRQSLVEEKFQQFLQRRVDGGDFRVDTTAVETINAEDGNG
ncbi:peptidylprolyl isomerase [Actinoplanes derwentensis]|uniref:Uncharacterized protein n=1 Tax=Actinoplanes derwentensis TaxID=113562 RepID=A0A1H2DE72_9ACTN|nr:peptidylprolyl isomerase [Actinoplanes derwentensis]GID84802.1 hypothetical protein Ade03nite_37260 [Actinoplanes derwentensis]SDT81058.1 hypothetical protein SAMN04489716_9477 [Actinoplanes derwentensis]